MRESNSKYPSIYFFFKLTCSCTIFLTKFIRSNLFLAVVFGDRWSENLQTQQRNENGGMRSRRGRRRRLGSGWSWGHRQSFVAAISHPLPVMTRLEARMISSTGVAIAGVTTDPRARSPRAGPSGTAGKDGN